MITNLKRRKKNEIYTCYNRSDFARDVYRLHWSLSKTMDIDPIDYRERDFCSLHCRCIEAMRDNATYYNDRYIPGFIRVSSQPMKAPPNKAAEKEHERILEEIKRRREHESNPTR